MSIYDQRPWRSVRSVPESSAPAPDPLTQFRRTARSTPSQTCIVFEDEVLTFADVDRLSDQLAIGMAQQGVGPATRVALMLQNVPQFPVALLAAWKLGGSVVPVNPMWKAAEVDHLIADSRPSAFIADVSEIDPSVSGAVKSRAVFLISTDRRDVLSNSSVSDTIWSSLLKTPGDLTLVTPDPDGLACITYTSGTTGKPKGAMNTHGNVASSAHEFALWSDVSAGDVCLGIAPLFHVTGLVLHVALGFVSGMPVVLDGRFDPASVAQLADKHAPTFSIAAMTAYQSILNECRRQGRGSWGGPRLSKVFSGGSAMMPTTLEAFEQLTGAYVHNVYGMTETTSPSHAVPLGQRAPVDVETGAISVGIPIGETICRVVDADGSELPAGSIGELITEGPQVFAGYWQNPQASEDSMLRGGVRTGDVGYMDDAGWFYVIDRKKDMINASGFKVWPREIEDLLGTHLDVLESAVVGIPDEYRGETVVAYVVLRNGSVETAETLIAFAKERLAAYKYPRVVHLAPSLPKTTSGKVLRRILRANAITGMAGPGTDD